MLKTEKLLNKYGLTASEVEAILEVDVLSSLMKAKEIDKLSLHVSLLDDRVLKYLESEDIKNILQENKKESIVEDLEEDFDFEDFDFDLDKEITSGFDIRVTDLDEIDSGGSDDETLKPPILTKPKEPAPKSVMANVITFDNVSASNFFSKYVKMSIPEVDSEGALVFQDGNVLIRGFYESDFSRLGSMALSNVNMRVEILSKNAEDILEYSKMYTDAAIEEVDKEVLSLSREEVSKVFNTQQYLNNGTEVNTSFNAIESILVKENKKERFDKSALNFSVGKAVHPSMVRRSNFYITPKTLYGLANCDEFFSASVGSYSYITNYCEGNDLKQLRIFEIGGGHLNVPFSNTRNETISNSKVQDDSSTFSGKVGGIIGDTYTKNETLYEVGFTQVLPKDIKYDKVDNLSEGAGYFVFSSPSSARTFYVPAVVYNYFKKFYGITEVKAGITANSGLYTIYFVKGSDVQGFIMIEKKNAPSASPARLLPTNPLEYAMLIIGRTAVDFTDKVDIESEKSIEYMGKTRSRPVVEEFSFEEKILFFEQALEVMTVGEDDEEIAELEKEIERFLLTITNEDDDEEQAEEGIKESIAMIPEPEDELGQMAVANDQDILPTPSADETVMEEIIEDEKEDALDVDSDDIDFDLDDDEHDISDYYAEGGQTYAKGGSAVSKAFVLRPEMGDKVRYKTPLTKGYGDYVEVEIVEVGNGNYPKIELNNGHSARWNGKAYQVEDMSYTIIETYAEGGEIGSRLELGTPVNYRTEDYSGNERIESGEVVLRNGKKAIKLYKDRNYSGDGERIRFFDEIDMSQVKNFSDSTYAEGGKILYDPMEDNEENKRWVIELEFEDDSKDYSKTIYRNPSIKREKDDPSYKKVWELVEWAENQDDLIYGQVNFKLKAPYGTQTSTYWHNGGKSQYSKGGSTYAEGGDLFEHYERLPDNVQELYFSWGDRLADGAEYEDLKQMLSEFEELGYTFDYGLDAEPYDLRAIDNV
jgi:hypothetical protein